MTEKVNFHPTKKLFIEALTRDVPIKYCILDLLDNAVDSYIRKGYDKTHIIKLDFNKDEFNVFDDCGGIPKNELKDQVFRFGAVEKDTAPTIGMYGVGLKRSIFKLGKIIVFETDDGSDYCKLRIDVDDWLKKDDEVWDLELTETSISRLDGKHPYTKINITALLPETIEAFTPEFENNIKETIKIYYSQFIQSEQLGFYINGQSTEKFQILISVSNDYKPVKREIEYEGVQIQIFCWLDIGNADKKRQEREAGRQGWNVYMNKRLVVLDDTRYETGWRGSKPYLPKYHSIYNQFRGIVFLTSNDPSKLPINTSKNGLNVESKVYTFMLDRMCEVARPFIDYLADKYNEEKANVDAAENKVTEDIQEQQKEQTSKQVTIEKATFDASFVPPQKKETKSPVIRLTSIQYQRPKEQVEKMKRVLEVSSNSEVGSMTFDYFWDVEGLNET